MHCFRKESARERAFNVLRTRSAYSAEGVERVCLHERVSEWKYEGCT